MASHDPDSPPEADILAIERRPPEAWPGAVLRSLAQLLRAPGRTCARVHEPVDHGAVVRLLASVRLPLWALTLLVCGLSIVREGRGVHIEDRALAAFIAPPLAEALAAWLLLMVPLALPVLYFAGGLVGHLGLTLTGGAHRSVGASMRAFGLTLAPVLLLVGLGDLALYGGLLSPMAYARFATGLLVLQYLTLSFALAGTHRIPLVRALLVAPLPVVLTQGALWLRALSVLAYLPGLPPPPPELYLP